MKNHLFRPLRRIKTTSKVVVAAYPQWRKILSADYAGLMGSVSQEYGGQPDHDAFMRSVDREYAGLPEEEHVYNHRGEPLFWRDFDPARIPVFEYNVLFDLAAIQAAHPFYAIRWTPEGRINYSSSRLHLDCDGVPAFSHYTISYVAEHQAAFAEYEPLTVGIVVKWFGWLLYQRESGRL